MHRVIFFLLLSIVLKFQALASTYYVDITNGKDTNDGTTTLSAWQNISKVNASSFQPGDEILFVRGGIWYETLEVSSDGTTEAPIIYSDYGEGVLPIIDGSDQRSNCIFVNTKKHIIIRNFSLMNNNENGTIRIIYSLNVAAENNLIYATGKGGIFIENSSNCTLKENIINTPSGEFNRETDGIYSQRNSYTILEKNKILISNSHPEFHIDGIQSYIDHSIIIRNNHIVQNNSKPASQGIYCTLSSGINYIYNNVVDYPNSVSSVVGFRSLNPNTTLYLVHNTLIGKGANIIHISGSPFFTIKNNILKAMSSNYSIINIEADTGHLIIDYNLYFNNGNPAIVVYHGTGLTMQQWNDLGFDQNGVVSDPLLKRDYTLNLLSPAIDAGTDLGLIYRFDKGGTQRPQLNGIDIGAYESVSNTVDTDSVEIPSRYELSQNYPNPFNPSTTITYSLPEPSNILIELFDLLGRKVTTLVDEFKTAGEHSVQLAGAGLSSGVYIYRLKSNQFSTTRKMILMK